MLFTLLTKQTAPRKTSLMTTAEAAKIGSISPTGFKDPLAPLKDKESGDMANRTIDFFTVRHFACPPFFAHANKFVVDGIKFAIRV
jgi:hypothetical protein